jgi:hypothetical protein
MDATQFSTLLNYELHSANRYRRFVSIVAIGTTNGIPEELPKVMHEATRDVDVLLQGQDQWTILMPETDTRGVMAAIKRYISRSGQLDLRYGAASFPADALDEDELLSVAFKRLENARRQPETVIVAEG